MAKNLLAIMPKLSDSERWTLKKFLGIETDQELAFQDRLKTAMSLEKCHKLATKIYPYWPLLLFASHVFRVGRMTLIALLIVAAIAVPFLAIVAIGVHYNPWWLTLFIPYSVLAIAATFTITDISDD